MKIGLFVEGGGMRGFFAAGVLQALKDLNIFPDYTLGISSGALNVWCHQTHQDFKHSFLNVRRPWHLLNIKGYLREGVGILDPAPVFSNVRWDTPKELWSRGIIEVAAVSALNADPIYWRLNDAPQAAIRSYIQASASIPVLMPNTIVEGESYVDGGIIDSIPIQRALDLKLDRIIMVLTRAEGYRKHPQRMYRSLRKWLRTYPKLEQAMRTRHIRYNEALKLTEDLASKREILLLRPDQDLIGRTEINPRKMQMAFKNGLDCVRAQEPLLLDYLNG